MLLTAGCGPLALLVVLWTAGVSSSQLSEGITNLAMDMAEIIEKGTSQNFVLSPYSAHSAFSQVLVGSAGTTQAELQNLLGISTEESALYGNLRKGLKSGQSQLKLANMLALAKGFKPKPEYNAKLQSRFQSNLKEFDFANDREGAANEINSFVNEATSGNIDKLVEEDQLDALTRLILVNAIYFKAPWKTSFDRSDTFEGDFITLAGSVRTQFMSSKLKVRVLNDDVNKVDVVELPYSDASKSLLLLMATDGDSTELVAKARRVKLGGLRDKAPISDTVVTLPPFRVRSRTNLKDIMRSLGASSMFSEQADFSNLSDQPLYVSSAIQDAKIEVTEEGTEAAAATAVSIGLRSSQRTRQFFADRPFLFILYDFTEDIPLFVGKISDPTESSGLAGPQPLIQRSAVAAGAVNLDGPAEPAPAGGASAPPCAKYLNDYPNAIENVKLCEVAEKSQLFDWLRSFRQVCEQSSDLNANFVANNCGQAWCEWARNERQAWSAKNGRLCGNAALKKANTLGCKELANQISAITRLNCNF